jgi:hypothetical protein
MWEGIGSVALFGGLFTFLAVAAWSASRTRERELYYKSELMKKAMEMPGPESAAVLAHMKEEEARAERRARVEKRKGLLIGGLTTVGVGLGLMIFLHRIDDEARGIFLVGLMPLFVGLAMLAASRMVKDE